MTQIATRKTKVGDVLKHEYMPTTGYCRQEVTVTVAANMPIGAVLELSAGKYIWVVKANVANAVAVLVDDRVYDKAAGDHKLVVLVRGPSQVGRSKLSFADAVVSADIDTASAALAAKGIEVVKQV